MIYCVEDERNIRELIVYTLESSGFHAKGMDSGQELMQELEKELKPDINAAAPAASSASAPAA